MFKLISTFSYFTHLFTIRFSSNGPKAKNAQNFLLCHMESTPPNVRLVSKISFEKMKYTSDQWPYTHFGHGMRLHSVSLASRGIVSQCRISICRFESSIQ